MRDTIVPIGDVFSGRVRRQPQTFPQAFPAGESPSGRTSKD